MSERRRSVIVTGGAKGIGQSISQTFAARESAVIVADVDQERGARVAESIREGGGEATFFPVDVASSQEVNRLFAYVDREYGGVDVLVNNAGIAYGDQAQRHFLDTDEAMWDGLMAVNLKGMYLCSHAAARMMVDKGIEGCIINVSSCGATRAHRSRVAYDAAKGAIEAATRAMALDLAYWKIRVNAIAPGAIAVEGRIGVGDEREPGALIPIGRLGEPADVAGAAWFLASSDASYMTGQIVTVDGGLSAQLRPPAMDVTIQS